MRRRPKLRPICASAAVAVALVLSLASTTALAIPLGARTRARAPRLQVGGDAWKLFQATNESRGRFDVPKLRLNRELSVAARRHSVAMSRAGELFHTPDVGVYLQGIAWQTWGENVGFTPRDVSSMQQAFMGSRAHRNNILNRAFGQVAIGAVRVDGTLWVTVFFYG